MYHNVTQYLIVPMVTHTASMYHNVTQYLTISMVTHTPSMHHKVTQYMSMVTHTEMLREAQQMRFWHNPLILSIT